MLCLWLLLLDLLRRIRTSSGSATSKPPALAISIKISVKPTTPTRRPLILDPGRELADTEGPEGCTNGALGDASTIAVESAVEACGMFAWV